MWGGGEGEGERRESMQSARRDSENGGEYSTDISVAVRVQRRGEEGEKREGEGDDGEDERREGRERKEKRENEGGKRGGEPAEVEEEEEEVEIDTERERMTLLSAASVQGALASMQRDFSTHDIGGDGEEYGEYTFAGDLRAMSAMYDREVAGKRRFGRSAGGAIEVGAERGGGGPPRPKTAMDSLPPLARTRAALKRTDAPSRQKTAERFAASILPSEVRTRTPQLILATESKVGGSKGRLRHHRHHHHVDQYETVGRSTSAMSTLFERKKGRKKGANDVRHADIRSRR